MDGSNAVLLKRSGRPSPDAVCGWLMQFLLDRRFHGASEPALSGC